LKGYSIEKGKQLFGDEAVVDPSE